MTAEAFQPTTCVNEREIDRLFAGLQEHRAIVAGSGPAARRLKLKRLHDTVLARRGRIQEALYADMRKPPSEVDLTEIYAVVLEARHAMRHLKRWMRPRRVSTPLAFLGSSSKIYYEPKGVVLIIAPWNFPLNLTLGPLVSAVAAGNSAIVKPSEMIPATAQCIHEIIAEVFPENEVAVVEGDAAVSQALLRRPFDHIFFTGSPAVGKAVMRAAAEHLTSVTLELGGKSPVVIDESANLREAARKIAWGKFLNNGQTCVAPDYLLVHSGVQQDFSRQLGLAVTDLFGSEENAAASESYGRVVNERHHGRLSRILDEAVAAGARVLRGGKGESAQKFFPPTILENAPAESAVMREEIFGPVLPVVPYDDLDEAIRLINEKDKPLALYIFSRDQRVIDRVLSSTSAGGTMINDVALHFFQANLPFGGVGVSGFGKSHGWFGFEAFSNARGVVRQLTRFSGIQFMYPPYGKLAKKLIDLTIRYF